MARNRRITLIIDSCLKDVEFLGVAVHGICREAGFSPKTAKRIKACIVEAANNVIKHAYENRSGNPVEVVCEQHDDQMVFFVSDQGISMGQLEPRELDFDPDDTENLPEGGMGLYIIQRIMDSVQYVSRDGKNIFIMTRKFSEQEKKDRA